MLQLLKRSKFFILFMIFINISSIISAEITNIPIVKTHAVVVDKENIINQLFNEDGTLLYDAVLTLLEELENNDLDNVCSKEDRSKINHFLAFLSKQGILPDATEAEKADLEQDIQELLNPSENSIVFDNSYYRIDNYQILPHILYGQEKDFRLCKSWLKKQCKHTAKFIKKHKTAIIVGAVIVVATAAIIVTAVSISSAATAAAVTSVAAVDSSKSKSDNNDIVPINNKPTQSVDNLSSNIAGPALPQSFEDQISKVINENNKSLDHDFYNNYERYIGATLAHEALQNIPNDLNLQGKTYEDIIIQGHGKIDCAFGTNQTPMYLEENNNNFENKFQENFFYFQGQQALNEQYYDKAVDSFGKAIEANPNNHNIYLDRAFAYLQTGEFDHSLNDYNSYKEIEQKNLFSKSLDIAIDGGAFCIGVRIGLDKGCVGSGKQLLSFATTTISHPIDTIRGVYEGFSALSKLACSQEWNALSHALIPEVYQLIEEWETLSPKEKGERSGYLIGKLGGDILIPGAAAKLTSKGIKGAKELTIIAKKLQKTEKIIVLEAFAESGGKSGKFAEFSYANRIVEETESTGKRATNIAKKIASISKKELNIVRDINDVIFSKHAIEQMTTRNISKKMIKNGIKNGKLYFDPKGDSFIIISKNGYSSEYDLIIARGAKSNKIVTTFQSNKKICPRYIEVIVKE